MAVVRIQINGRIYEIACDDGQEEHLRLLADEVDERVRGIARAGVTGEIMALLLASITMADELLEHKNTTGGAPTQSVAQASAHKAELERAQAHIHEMETSVARTLDEIAGRIEAIAQRIEIG